MDNLPFKYDFEVNHFTFTYSVQYVNRWTFKIFLVLKIQDIQKRFNFCPNCFIISVEARAKGGKEYMLLPTCISNMMIKKKNAGNRFNFS